MLATPQLLLWYPEATSILNGTSRRDNGFQTKPGTANESWETTPPLWSPSHGAHDDGLLPAGCTVCASPGIPIVACQGGGTRDALCTPHMPSSPEAGMGALGKPQASRPSCLPFPWAYRGGLQTRGLENRRAISGRMWRGKPRLGLGGGRDMSGCPTLGEDMACSRSVSRRKLCATRYGSACPRCGIFHLVCGEKG